MSTLYEISQNIKKKKYDNSNKEKYSDIIKIFKNDIHNKFTIEEISSNNYVVSDILDAFKKIEKYEKGLNFIDKYLKINIDDISDNWIVRNYGWCLYYLLKQKFNIDEHWNDEEQFSTEETAVIDETINTDVNSFFKKIRSILNKLHIEDTGNFVSSKLLFIFLKLVDKKYKNSWGLGFELLNSINPIHLSKEISTGKYKGKDIEYASDFENWHAQKSKALFALGKYDECITFSHEVLNKGILKHYDYDIWFKRRIGLCHFKLNDLKKALSYLSDVIKFKKDWFIQKDIAEIFYELGDYEKSIKYAIDAALNRGEQKFKCDLYILLYNILKHTKDKGFALKHIQLAAAIKIKEEWKLGETLSNYLSENKLSAEGIDFILLEKELKLFYHSKLKTGTLQKINPQSKIGFINSNGNSIFFRFNAFSGSPSKIKDNIEVYFSDDISYDRKRNQDSIAAIYLCIKNN